MMPRYLLPLLLLLACAPKTATSPEDSLPDKTYRVEVTEPATVLERAAQNDDPSMRGRALDLLVRTSSSEGGGRWAARALFDPDPWVQRLTVRALASRIHESASVDRLEAYVRRTRQTDPYVRGAAAIALASAGHTGTGADLSAAWRAESQAWRSAPLQLAALVMGDADAAAPLQRALASANIGLEVEFMLDVGRAGHVELLEAVQQGQELVEDEMVLAFAAARVALGDASGEGALRKALSDDDPIVRLEALDYLSAMHDPTADALLNRASHQPDELVRTYAQLALLARGSGSIDTLDRAGSHDDHAVRALAVRFAVDVARRPTASRKDLKVAQQVVHLALLDEDPEVRVLALKSAAELGMAAEAPALLANLGDEYQQVRVEAAGAMLLLAKDATTL